MGKQNNKLSITKQKIWKIKPTIKKKKQIITTIIAANKNNEESNANLFDI